MASYINSETIVVCSEEEKCSIYNEAVAYCSQVWHRNFRAFYDSLFSLPVSLSFLEATTEDNKSANKVFIYASIFLFGVLSIIVMIAVVFHRLQRIIRNERYDQRLCIIIILYKYG